MLRLRIPIGFKVYGVACTILLVLIAAAAVNYQRMRRVNASVSDMAFYLLPLQQSLTTAAFRTREQEVYFARIFRLFEAPRPDLDRIASDREALERLGTMVDRELAAASILSGEAALGGATVQDVIEFARLEPTFRYLAQDHQQLHDQALKLIDRLADDQPDQARLLETSLDERRIAFDQRIEETLMELRPFNQEAFDRIEEHEQALLNFNIAITTAAVLLGLGLAFVLTRHLVRPIQRLVEGAQSVERGDLDRDVEVDSRDEVETLATAFNEMVGGMRRKRLLEESFGRYVDPRVAETLLEHHDGTKSRKLQATVLFSDIAGFSSINELLTPDRLVTLINEYRTLAAAPIRATDGMVDKFIGDAVVAFWGPPFVKDTEYGRLACEAALDQMTQLAKLRRMLPDIVGIQKGLPQLDVRIGLATGEAVVGSVGTLESRSYTMIGRVVEVAEMLEEINKRYGTRILMTEETMRMAGPSVVTRLIDHVALGEGQSEVPIHELVGFAGEVAPDTLRLCESFQAGLQHHRAGEKDAARMEFEACLTINPTDGPTSYYLDQLEGSQRAPIPPSV